jgi:hypothetical protein
VHNITQLKTEIFSLHSLLALQLKQEETGASSSCFKASRITRYKIERLEKRLAVINNHAVASRREILGNISNLNLNLDLQRQLEIKKLLCKSAKAFVIEYVIKNEIEEARFYLKERKKLEREINRLESKIGEL